MNLDPITHTYIGTTTTSTTSTTNNGHGPITISKQASVLTNDKIKEAGELLHNILQDALVICEEDCCAEETVRVDFVALGESLVSVIIAEYMISDSEKIDLKERLAVATADLANFKRQLMKQNHHDSSKLHEKKLTNFKSRKYPPSFNESIKYSPNSYNKEEQ